MSTITELHKRCRTHFQVTGEASCGSEQPWDVHGIHCIVLLEGQRVRKCKSLHRPPFSSDGAPLESTPARLSCSIP